ncbi:MAG TPA: hypothetical protein QF753_22890 [Victivallales bacterium]|nr:hypothetical protein [Victivallales bacterium]
MPGLVAAKQGAGTKNKRNSLDATEKNEPETKFDAGWLLNPCFGLPLDLTSVNLHGSLKIPLANLRNTARHGTARHDTARHGTARHGKKPPGRRPPAEFWLSKFVLPQGH